jgi:hypothetical protein
MRVTPYHLFPSTDVFVALLRGEVISTVSLVGDSPMGLPMESIYHDVVAQRREQRLRVAEVTCLADRRRDFYRFLPVFVELSRILVQTARRHAVDQLLVTVHPKHARFYERFLAFQQVGQPKSYPLVCDHPAVALCLDFAHVDQQRAEDYQRLFGRPVPEAKLQPQPMSQADCDYFRPMIDPHFQLTPIAPADPSMPAAARPGAPTAAA